MRFRRWRWALLVAFGLFGIFGCLGTAGNAPRRGMTISLSVDQRQALFEQLERFAASHDFSYHLDEYKTDHKPFLVSMYWPNLKLLANDVPGEPEMIELDFYDRNGTDPSPQETLEQLFGELKASVSRIPGVVIIEER